ncbi:uncharacterized protein LOC110265374 [Arachis ipaensis]|uniref:uncharacterized protein LOC110265374 n=1 Tax=Arachis ipaensis TaxID=130454 RepID=UPI000A2B8AC4|nr:uncharacterized protein LOC110265374 [Arachis ipaensis]
MGLKESDLKNHQHGVMRLGDNYIKPDGTISLPICLGTGDTRKSVMADFVVLRDSTAYNIILGRKTINEFSAVIYTKFLTMKFITDKGTVGSIRGDLETAVACDSASLFLRKESKRAVGIFLADLDIRIEDKPRPEPEEDMEKFQIGKSADQFTFVNRNLPHELKGPLMEIVRANDDLFAWTPSDMPGLDPEATSHRLAIKPDAKPVAQRRRKISQERAEEVARQTAGLLEAGFIKELEYSTWLSNVVLIPMHRPDKDKTAFITPGGTYCYKVMPFGLKNAGATYQRLMSRVFHDLIGKSVEVYVDDILVKTAEPNKLIDDLQAIFKALRMFNMRLNPLKCAFAMEAGKFLRFMITQRGVEANPDKCEAVLKMTSPGCIKDVQRLTGKLTALSRFLGASAERAIPFFNLMKKGSPSSGPWHAKKHSAISKRYSRNLPYSASLEKGSPYTCTCL